MIGVLTLLAVCQDAEAGEVAFSSPPVVTRVDKGARIEFAASTAADCAIAILDSTGETVRHLAAGALDKQPPPPLKPGLAQSLVWDGSDDFGRPATGSPFQIRVCLGLKPTFDGMIGFNPASLGSIRALATDPKGELYVFHAYAVAVGEDTAYIGDRLNRRVVRVKLAYQVEATCPLVP
ncbi:MAG: flagellar hook assembly protein FlgD [Planctomycetota bacterium]|jgi:hypothetical protein